MEKPKVLFLCTQNSARSQMAEGLLRHLYGEHYQVYSAGTRPAAMNPFAVRAMERAGVDISQHRSKSVDEFIDSEFDFVVTVCDRAREECPYFPSGKNIYHRSFADPAAFEGTDEEKLEYFGQVRDEIRRWIEETFSPQSLK
ncbi:MAG: arsenate reductase ArsC [Syntrophomonadaceae bacterium]|nr:arsenate reductase ArsC [Syntrophomonadaceae bacterium]